MLGAASTLRDLPFVRILVPFRVLGADYVSFAEIKAKQEGLMGERYAAPVKW